MSTLDLGNITVSGPDVLNCDAGNYTFSVPSLTGCTYAWTVTANVTIVSGQGTANLVVTPASLSVSAGAVVQVTITDSKGYNRVAVANKGVTLGAPFPGYISYVAHAGCGAYLFTYNGNTSAYSPPAKYFEIQSVNSVAISPYPGTPAGLPAPTAYDVYGGGISVPSGTAQVKVRYKNACGWSDWTLPFSLASCSHLLLYPSPASGTITIGANNSNSSSIEVSSADRSPSAGASNKASAVIRMIRVFDVTGKMVLQKSYSSGGSSATLDVSSLAAGNYVAHVLYGEEWSTIGFIKGKK